MKPFIGLDVSLAKTAVCVVNEHGKIVKETEITSEPEALWRFLGTPPGTIVIIGLEAGLLCSSGCILGCLRLGSMSC